MEKKTNMFFFALHVGILDMNIILINILPWLCIDISSTFVCVVASDDDEINGESACEPDILRNGFDIERRLFKLGDARVLESLIV